jgi:anti-sigma factor RsiW
MTARDFNERDIHMALDGELPEDDRTAYQSWLDAHPDMRARAARLFRDRDLLRSAVAGIEAEPLPARLTQLLHTSAAPADGRRLSRWWLAAAASLLLAIGLGGGYTLGASGWLRVEPQGVQLADSAIAAHNIYSAEKLHVVEVGADQKDHLQRWLSKRLDLTLVAPDLTDQGYHLIGGRLLPAGTKSAAQFMYEDPSGNRVSLYVARESSDRETGFRFVQEGGTRAVFWLEENYGCVVAGAVPDGTLSTIADHAYRQLLKGFES